jgi:hypothetical protein
MDKVVRHLNWYYYGMMVITLVAMSAMYYVWKNQLYTPIDRTSTLGMVVQYFVIFDALITIPLGLYLIKWRKPTTLEAYQPLAVARILLVSNSMPLGIIAYFLLADEKGCYMSMFWVAAIAAIGWYFTKPTLSKVDKEMTPQDPNLPTY